MPSTLTPKGKKSRLTEAVIRRLYNPKTPVKLVEKIIETEYEKGHIDSRAIAQIYHNANTRVNDSNVRKASKIMGMLNWHIRPRQKSLIYTVKNDFHLKN